MSVSRRVSFLRNQRHSLMAFLPGRREEAVNDMHSGTYLAVQLYCELFQVTRHREAVQPVLFSKNGHQEKGATLIREYKTKMILK